MLWTVRAAMLLYAGALMSRRREDLARWLWTAGCVLLWVHVGLAMHYVYGWDHARMVSETARQTLEVTGWRSGVGVWFNYAVMGLWAGDAAHWWSAGHRRYFGRARWVSVGVYGFLLFMVFNATVVFGRGETRWVGAAACVGLVVWAIVRRRLYDAGMDINRPALWILILTLSGAAWRAEAENWPGFRGPTGQGISGERGLPTKWSAASGVSWKTDVAGEGWSSPIVWADRVFLTAAREKGTSCRVIAIDAGSGKILWDVEAFTQTPGRKERRNSYATPTPVTDGRLVYAFFGGGGAMAMDFDGKPVWTNTQNEFYSQHGLGASPILYEDLLIMPWDHSAKGGPEPRLGWQIPWDKSFVLALDKQTGKERYRAMRGQSRIAHMTPRVVDVAGSPQLVSAAGDVIQGFDPRTGRRLWWVESGGEGVTPSPVFGQGMVFSSSGFATPVGGKAIRPAIRAFRLGGEGDVTRANLVWEHRENVPMLPSLLYVEGARLLYAISEGGILQCLNPGDGSVIFRQRLKGNYSASPVYADGRIYLLNDEGSTTVIEAGREFKELAYNELNEKTQASMAVSGGRLFIRTEKAAYCIGPSK
jgi:outer membrane protein assembly factor BamB